MELPRKPERALMIVNPVARSVTRPIVEVIEKALAADFKLDVHETNARGHATELAREAVAQEFQMVVVFSGDGTINEAANALVGTDIPLGLIPGGATNVLARGLGIPDDPIEAAVRLIHAVQERPPQRMSLGKADGRHFTFACGVGLDAEAMGYLEARKHKLTTRRSYEWAALAAIVRKGFGSYAGKTPDLAVRVDGEVLPASLSVLVANAHPYAYFKKWPLKVAPHATPDGGLDVLSANKLNRTGVPRLAFQIFSNAGHTKSKNMSYRHDVSSIEVNSSHPFPVQMDGDYLGTRSSLSIGLVRDAIWVYS